MSYWAEFDWLCPGCGLRNRFKKETCSHCDQDPSSVVQAWQLIYMADNKYLASGDYTQAERVYSRVKKLDPMNPVVDNRITLAVGGVSTIPARERDREKTWPTGELMEANFAPPGVIAKAAKKKVAIASKAPAKVVSEWKCAYCTFMNAGRAKKCEMCDNPKFEAAPSEEGEDVAKEPVTMWTCKMCSAKNLMTRQFCGICSYMGSSDKMAGGVGADEKVDDEDFQKMTRLMMLMEIDASETREVIEMMQTCKANVEKFPELKETISSFMALLDELKLKDAKTKLRRGVDLVNNSKVGIDDSVKSDAALGMLPDVPSPVAEPVKVVAPVSVKEKHVPVLEMYETLLKVAFVDNSVSEASIAYLAQVRMQYGITDADHDKCITEVGISKESYQSMVKKGIGMKVASKECVICMDELATHVVMDCMHLSVCGNCKDLAKSSKSCPECRGAIADLRKIY